MVSPKEVRPLASDLAGLRVLITRASGGAAAWSDALEAAGAEPVLYPTIETVPVSDWSRLDEALAHLARFDGVLFTSATAAELTCARPFGHPLPPGLRVVAVGASTAAALRARGWNPTLVPTDQRQEGILEALPPELKGVRFLFPQALAGREHLAEALRARGAVVEVIPVYETVARSPLPPLPSFEVALFASPSALLAFTGAHGLETLRERRFVVLGPTTAAAARKLGLVPDGEAAEPSISGLIAALSLLPRRSPR